MKKLLFVMTFTMLLAGLLFAQNPPTNLTYTLADHDVTLAWDAPQNGGGAEGVLRYDNGENADGIGTGGADDFDVAIRFEPASIEEYNGSYLSQIEFFPREENCEYSIKVWTGANAENLVVEQLVPNVTVESWNLVTLDTPIQIDASQELWFGYRCNTQTGYPAGVDAGPAVAGYGDMIYYQGAWSSIANDFGLDYNWNIAGYVTATTQRKVVNRIIRKITNNPSERDNFAFKAGHLAPGNNSDRTLTGYNIYRNDTLIATETDSTMTTYLDAGLADGVYNYYVTAVYDGTESDPTNTVTVDLEFGMIAGTVMDADSNPIMGATVEATTERYSTTTDDSGMYSMDVMVGDYYVTVTAEGFVTQMQQVTVVAGETATLDFTLQAYVEDLNPPRNLEAEVVANDVNLTWLEPSSGGSGDEWSEDFEDGVTPEGWEIQGECTDTSASVPGFWTVNDYSSADFSPMDTYHAGLWWSYDHQDEWLITPEFNCESGMNLEFWTAVYEGSVNADHYYVQVSTDGGTTWNPIWDASALTGNAWNYYQYSYVLDLSAYAGQSVKLAFNAVDGPTNDGLWYIWFVDNITVSNAAKTIHFNPKTLTFKHNPDIARDGNTTAITKLPTATEITRDLTGYNVYRDSQFLATTTDLSYTDADLNAGTYTYTVTALYTEGESAPTDPAEAIILGTGTINGTVTDDISGNPVEGATITAGEYTTDTAADGTYSLDVVEGTYDVTCDAAGYTSATEENVVINDGDVVTVDFSLIESINPPTNVVATANDADTAVDVTWDEPGQGGNGEEQWIHYDDGENADGIGTGGVADFDVAIKYDPDQLTDFDNMYLTKVRFFPREANCEYSIRVWQGTDAANLLVDQVVDNPTIEDWNEVMLDSSVQIDASQELWIGYRCNTQTGYPAGVDAGPAVAGYGDMIYYQGAWSSISTDFGLDYNWNIQGWLSNSARGDVASTPLVNNVSRKFNGELSLGNLPVSPNATLPIIHNRSIEGYNVYRLLEGDEDNEGNWTTLIEGTTDMIYTDNDWANVSSGIYKYAVKAVYTNNNLSDAAFSNVVYKDMTTTANVNVTDNLGNNIVGATATLTNIDGNDEHIYTVTTDASGVAAFTDVWKGEYNLLVTFDGYEDYTQNGIEILEPTEIDVELAETLLPPAALDGVIDGHTLTATWMAPGSFQSWSEDFEGGAIPEGWQATTNSAQGWYVTMNGSSDFFDIPAHDGYYACSNDDDANDDGSVDYLITPSQNFAALTSLNMTFDSFFNGSYSQTAAIEVSLDGGSTWDVAYNLTGADSWTTLTVDLSDYCGNSDVLIAFHSNDNGVWASGWAVDNVVMGSDTNVRALLGYNLYMDGSVVNGNTLIPETTYTQTDLPNGNHVWVVTAVYDGGESAPSNIFEGFVDETPDQIPAVTTLSGNYPNPFNPTTTIAYSISKGSNVSLDIYNIRGQKIKTLVNKYQAAKNYKVVWDGKDNVGKTAASGVYFYKLTTGKYVSTKKMILMK